MQKSSFKNKIYLLLALFFSQASPAFCNYLYHGTSMFYVDEIQTHGLTGKFPQELYEKMKLYWPHIKGCKAYARSEYIDWFFKRQDENREDGRVSLFFTQSLSVAKEFAGGSRILGEGPGSYATLLKECLAENKMSLKDLKGIQELSERLENGKRHPGIILVIKRDPMDSDQYSTVISTPMKPEELYILDPNKEDHLIPLKSIEGSAYIQKEMTEFLQKMNEEAKQIKSKDKYHQFDSNFLTGEGGYQLLSDALDDSDPEVQSKIGWELSKFKGAPGKGLELYRKAFRHSNKEIPQNAALSLSYYEGEDAKEIFDEVFESSDSSLKSKVFTSLVDFQKRGDARPFLIKALSDTNSVVKKKAIFELNSFKLSTSDFLTLLDLGLGKDSQEFFEAANGAIGNYIEKNSSQFFELFVLGLNHSNSNIRSILPRYFRLKLQLAQLLGNTEESQELLRTLLRALAKSNLETAAEIFSLLHELYPEFHQQHLAQFPKTPSTQNLQVLKEILERLF